MLDLVKIISGGQTGADQGGLEAGAELGLRTGGWIPQGFRTEDGPRPDLASYGLVEHQSSDYPPRTVANVLESDGTLIVGNDSERGSALTIRVCGEHGKPYHHTPYDAGMPFPSLHSIQMLRLWLERHHIRVLNVAGNRESKNRGIQIFTKELLIATVKNVPVQTQEMPILGFFEDYRFLSNFWTLADPIEFEAEFYHTVEHAFQAAKSTDARIREVVRIADTAGKAKRIGDALVCRSDWEEIKTGIMKQLLLLKFKEFGIRKKLLDTGSRLLVESNTWHDNFWGSCTCMKCGNNGKNMLGKLLMEVRAYYACKSAERPESEALS